LSRFPSFIRWLVGVVAVLAPLWVVLETARHAVISRVCVTDVLADMPGISGFDFKVSETDCWHSPAISVFVSMRGGSKRTRLFQYHRVGDEVPIIASIAEHTVQISLSKASSISCRRDKWGALTIKYDIGTVEYPGLHDPPPEC
jgi:hypothetical protein